ncbi:MAG TPA: hypothetical protein VJQ52_23260 [Steroidobacteraceae bacterium]|nr:hypothetical protein [Steroidobacteraceae bacterium]
MSTNVSDGSPTAWRPTPWIAALLGFFGGGLGLLYVQRAWYAIAYFAASIGGVLLLLGAILVLGIGSRVSHRSCNDVRCAAPVVFPLAGSGGIPGCAARRSVSVSLVRV